MVVCTNRIICLYQSTKHVIINHFSTPFTSLLTPLRRKQYFPLYRQFNHLSSSTSSILDNGITDLINHKDQEDELSYLEFDSLKTTSFIASANSYTDSILSTKKSSINWLKEFSHKPSSHSFPDLNGDYYYYFIHDKRYPSYMRINRLNPSSEEECVIDLNEKECKDSNSNLQLGQIRISQNGRYVAYTVDQEGNEVFTLAIRPLTNSMDKPTSPSLHLKGNNITQVTSIAWSDSNVLYYTQSDSNGRPYRIGYVMIREDYFITPNNNILYEELDECYLLGIKSAKDGSYVFITSTSKEHSVVNIIDKNRHIKHLLSTKVNHQVSLEHQDDKFVLITNAIDDNTYQLYTIPDTGDYPINICNARPILPKSNNLSVLDIEVFEDYIALYTNDIKTFTPHLLIYHCKSKEIVEVKVSSQVGEIIPGSNLSYRLHVLRFAFTSPAEPTRHYDFDMKNNKLTLLQSKEELYAETKAYDLNNLIVKREWVNTNKKDDTIPLTLLYHKSYPPTTQSPCYLHVYGAYGECLSLSFNYTLLSLVSKGWVIAYAHVRGGGEKGINWHRSGSRINKYNSIHDLHSITQYIFNHRISHSCRLCLYGASAGSLTAAAVVNQYPHDYAALVLKNPLLDLVNLLSNTNSHLYMFERGEWIDPDISSYDQLLKCFTYSPYQNIPATANLSNNYYPSVFCLTSRYDIRIPYWQSSKYIARLQQLNSKKKISSESELISVPLYLLRVYNIGGHLDSGSEIEREKEESDIYNFLFLAIK